MSDQGRRDLQLPSAHTHVGPKPMAKRTRCIGLDTFLRDNIRIALLELERVPTKNSFREIHSQSNDALPYVKNTRLSVLVVVAVVAKRNRHTAAYY